MTRADFILLALLLLIVLPAHAQFDYLTNADNTLTVAEYLGTNENVNIPSVVDGLQVTGTGESAFNSDTLISVDIPGGITNMPSVSAFLSISPICSPHPARLCALCVE
jgi:hypothetical protein